MNADRLVEEVQLMENASTRIRAKERESVRECLPDLILKVPGRGIINASADTCLDID